MKHLLRSPKGLFAFSIFGILTFTMLLGVAFAVMLSAEITGYLLPVLVVINIFLIFSLVLQRQVGGNLFGEIGFLYLGITSAYTVLPAIAFMSDSLSPTDPLMLLMPEPSELAVHLWRHVFFVLAVAVGYILVRGRQMTKSIVIKPSKGKDDPLIVLLVGLVIICILSIIMLSAPVNSYYDHYTRYDHLPWVIKKFVSLCVRLNYGFYSILFIFLFVNYKKYRMIIPVAVALICCHEMVYSFGSRIQALIILLQVACLYNYFVKPINLKKSLVICLALGVLFSLVELFRSVEFDFISAKEAVSKEGFKSASEFGSVYFTGYHLYAERVHGTIPQVEWPMFISEIISLFTFGDFARWNPMEWYANNYYPDSAVPPFTLGPIADSAIWGGVWDLFFRGLINGAFFAYLVRCFISNREKWWGVAVYVYCFSTCILTLKYGIFNHLNLLEKNILPAILVVIFCRSLIPTRVKQISSLRGDSSAIPFVGR